MSSDKKTPSGSMLVHYPYYGPRTMGESSQLQCILPLQKKNKSSGGAVSERVFYDWSVPYEGSQRGEIG